MSERERVMEILNLVLQKIITEEKKYDEQEIISNLLARGYQMSEIDAAFELIFSVPDMFKVSKKSEQQKKDEGHRVFSLLEQVKISYPVQEQLLRFQNQGLIWDSEMEMLLLEAAIADEVEIGLKDLNGLLIKVIKDENRLMMMMSPIMIGEKYDLN